VSLSSLPKHDDRLQSLRGLAALSVLFGHAALILPPTPFTTLQGALFQAGPAVVLFYVLSGYVLGQSLLRDGGFWPFAWRRLTRLLPVLWASIALGAAVGAAMHGHQISGSSGWFDIFPRSKPGRQRSCETSWCFPLQ
jgi:peptidoglycan/LPS O-acetylase OafA/YrhL